MQLKEHILEESLRLFTLKGFLSTSLNDILKACHTSKGGFYNHFASKEALLLQVLQRARRNWREKNLAGLESIPSPIDKVKRLLLNYRDRYLKDTRNMPGGCPFIMLAVELADQHATIAKALNKGFSDLKNKIRRLLDKARQRGEIDPKVDTASVAEMLFAGMLGASLMFGLDKSFARLDTTIDSLLAYLESLEVATA
jgi:TetR/AcrR family transcriptional repressor of nem operon